jgi:hypothetical protein
MAKTKKKVYSAAESVKPYVERALADEKVRADVMHAYQTAAKVYRDLARGDTAPFTLASRVATDEDLRDRLREAVEDLQSAAERLQGKKDHSARNATLLIAGIALGILFNPVTGPETRRFLRDLVFGGGDETPGTDESFDGGGS